MAYMSHKNKFVFFRFPRVASTTLLNAFTHVDGSSGHNLIKPHMMPNEVEELYPDKDDYFKIVFVRNPWDMHVSLYHHFKDRWGIDNFRSFMLLFNENRVRSVHKYEDFVFHEDGSLRVDYVGRYETLQKSFDEACKLIGVDSMKLEAHHHISEDRKPYTDKCYYSEPWMIKAVRTYQGAKFIDKLGYAFDCKE